MVAGAQGRERWGVTAEGTGFLRADEAAFAQHCVC